MSYSLGTAINSTNTTDFAAALSLAQDADLIVYAGGIDVSVESEGHDRTSIEWPGNQLDLIDQLSQLGKPLVVVQFGGGQVDDTALLGNPNVSSIVWAGYPGQDGGYALIDVLVGKQPVAGRLTTTQYQADYINDISIFDPNMRPSNSSPGRTYKWLTQKPVLPFGYGLHYTTFSQDWCKTPKVTYDIASLVGSAQGYYGGPSKVNDASLWTTVAVNVINTGKRASDYVGLVFITTNNAGPAPYPNKWLVSYARVHNLAAGATEEVQLDINLGGLTRANTDGDLVVYPGDYSLLFDYDSSLVFNFTLTGESKVLTPLARQQASYNYTVPVHSQA